MKKQSRPKAQKKEESAITLGDRLNQDLFNQLKVKQQELKVAEERKKEEEEQKKREERKLKDKNKSFEELFNESNMNWQDFKK